MAKPLAKVIELNPIYTDLTCGCEHHFDYTESVWEVEGQLHCTHCMEEATSCKVPVRVRKVR